MSIFLNVPKYNEYINNSTNNNEFLAIFSLYMFSMEGCPPCKSTLEMLFGNGDQLEYSVWSIIIKKTKEELPSIIKKKLTTKIATKDSNGTFIKNAINTYSLETIINHINNNINIVFVKFMRDSDMSIIENFNIRGFPSFTMCFQSKNHNIINKNNPVVTKTGGFMGTGIFAQWINHNVELLLDIYLDTLLINWIQSILSINWQDLKIHLLNIIKDRLEQKILNNNLNGILIKNAITKHSLDTIVNHINNNINIGFMKSYEELQNFTTHCSESQKEHNEIITHNTMNNNIALILNNIVENYLNDELINWIKNND